MKTALQLITGFLVFFFGAQTFASPQTQGDSYSNINDTAAKLHRYKNYDWQTAPWTEDNAPYHRIRLVIERAIAQGQNPATLEQRYRVASADFYDPQKQFRWAYAAYKAHKAGARIREDTPFFGMDHTLRPLVYDWTRLRYMWEVEVPNNNSRALTINQVFAARERLIEVGKRLLQQDPNDYYLMYITLDLLDASQYLTNRRLALSYALKLRQHEPQRIKYIACVGGAYMNLWQLSGNPQHGTLAVAAYQKYLRLAQPNDPFRHWAQFWIKDIHRCSDSNGRYRYRSAKS